MTAGDRTDSHVVLVSMSEGDRAEAIGRALAAESMMPVVAFSRAALLTFANEQSFAAIVVDISLDGGAHDPAKLIAEVQAANPAPVVVLGYEAGSGEHWAVGLAGLLGAGAPPADVVGTVLTATGRQSADSSMLSLGPLTVDPRNYDAWHGPVRLDLTPTELRILAELVDARGDLVAKGDLQQAAWRSSGRHDDNRLQAHIARLRHKLAEADPVGVLALRTVRGVGFRLEVRLDRTRAQDHESTGTVAQLWDSDR
jgi:DNA-binding response OmpR family regulator